MSKEKILEIKSKVDIVEVISDFVILRKAGRNFLGLCPFHSEKTPSFNVSPERQAFHCFGCGLGGDVFTFLEKIQGISFFEAMNLLAKKTGVALPTKELSEKEKFKIQERAELYLINKKALEFFKKKLSGNQIAQEYLEKRKLSQSVIDKFQLGFAEDSWDSLYNYLKKDFSLNIIENSGLFKKKDKGGFYDAFRNRIIFPIFDTTNQVIAFGGRVLDSSLPKYLNSPETLLYNKSKSLYGLNFAKQEARKQNEIYIVEGYLDLIALYQHKIENVVATLGTALNIEHIKILKGVAEKVILVYDVDNAGLEAAKRGTKIFLEEGIEAKIFVLPEKEDPDSYIFQFGRDAFFNESKESLKLINFLIKMAIKKYGLSIEGKVKIIEEFQDTVLFAKDNLQKSLYLKEIADSIDIDEKVLYEKFNSLSPKKFFTRNEVKKTTPTWDKFEEQIIIMMLQVPEIIEEIKAKNIINFIDNETLKYIGNLILKNNTKDIIHLVDDEEKKSIISNFILKNENWTEANIKLILSNFLSRIKEKKEKELIRKIKKAEEEKNEELILQLFEELKKLK